MRVDLVKLVASSSGFIFLKSDLFINILSALHFFDLLKIILQHFMYPASMYLIHQSFIFLHNYFDLSHSSIRMTTSVF